MMNKKEYKNAQDKLTKENRKTIRKMRHYLETRYLNEIVFEGIMNDLVGMALESQQRGTTFADSIGMDYKKFCHELVENATKQTALERTCFVAQWLIAFVGLIVPLMYVFYLIFFPSTPELNRFLLIAPASQLFMYLSTATVLIIGWFVVKRLTYSSQFIVLGIYIALVILTFLLTDIVGTRFFGDFTLKIKILPWILGSALLIVFFYLIKRVSAFTAAYKGKNK